MSLGGKFKGCLVGGLIGDCLGAPFEGERRATKSVLTNYFLGLSNTSKKIPYKPYTDDTAMTKASALSLIEQKGFDHVDMAKRFTHEFYSSPNRGYGKNVVDVFAALRATEFKDVFAPSKLQFDGRGSYGNGGAMRIAPVALFCQPLPLNETVRIAKEASLITHANRIGFNGAVLQCLAIKFALGTSVGQLNPVEYLKKLSSHMKEIEKYATDEIIEHQQSEFVYVPTLTKVSSLLERNDDVSLDEIDEELGTSIVAHKSVPTAIYAFLRALNPISLVQTDDPFQRTIHFAISLGGDTDTIAAMAGNIAGAYYGLEEIPNGLQKHCEDLQTLIDLGEKLYSLVTAK